MATTTLDHPAIYVGTYHKYNCGSIKGAWLDLTDYADKSEFHAACAELHKDEEDPEFMFQDWENLPSDMVSESWVSEKVWEMFDLIENSHLDIEVFRAAAEADIPLDQVDDRYQGEYNTKADFAYELVESCGDLRDVPDTLARYFDYDAYARDLFLDGFTWVNGHVFSDY
jgi:antirestriction protein